MLIKSGDKMNLNNKGFTLVEVLAVLIILAAITGLAIPSFTSSLEVNDKKQEENRQRRIESAAEIYVTNNKQAIFDNLNASGYNQCYIFASDLESEGYISSDDNTKDDGSKINGLIEYNRNNNSYKYLASTGMSVYNCINKEYVVTISKEVGKTYYFGSEYITKKDGLFTMDYPTNDWNLIVNSISMFKYFCNIGGAALSPTCDTVCEIQNSLEVSDDGTQIQAKCIMKTEIT